MPISRSMFLPALHARRNGASCRRLLPLWTSGTHRSPRRSSTPACVPACAQPLPRRQKGFSSASGPTSCSAPDGNCVRLWGAALALALVAGGGSGLLSLHQHWMTNSSTSATLNDLKVLDNNAQVLQQMDQLLDDSAGDDGDSQPTT